MDKLFDTVILGAGPSGLSCALYCARSNLKTAIIDISSIGGAPSNYCEIENYLGFPKIQGWELCEKFEQHIDNFNIDKFPYEEIENVDLVSPIKKIKTKNSIFCAKTVVIAVGASPKKLNIKGEIENIGHGVSYCAVCDGAFYKDKIVSVVGGGNSALEESLYLTKFAKKVYLIHRRQTFRADKIIQQRVMKNDKIELILNSKVEEIISKEKVEAIKIKNLDSSEEKILKVDGIFPYIGLEANSKMFLEQIQLNKEGFILTNEKMETSVQGVYAIGDIRNTPLRQVITSVSDGAIAGVEVSKYLSNMVEMANTNK